MTVFKKVMLLCLVVMAIGSLGSGSQLKAQPGRHLPASVFYRELQPYGKWVPYGRYGRAWIPRVERDFRPYVTRGYWDYTEYGNTWVSDYEWGWAPFHYGRWAYDDLYGWLWLPDSEWAPAWVSWRYDDDYYGWAPLGPGVNINIHIPIERWIFVPKRYVTSRRVYDYCVPARRVEYVYGRSRTMERNYDRSSNRYVYGPRRDELERDTRRPVEVHQYDRDGHYPRAGNRRNDDNRTSSGDNYGGNEYRQDRRGSSEDNDPRDGRSDNWRNGRPERGVESSPATGYNRSEESGNGSTHNQNRNSNSSSNDRDRNSGNGGQSRPSRGDDRDHSRSNPAQGTAPAPSSPSETRPRPSRPSRDNNPQNEEGTHSGPTGRANGSSGRQTAGNLRPIRI